MTSSLPWMVFLEFLNVFHYEAGKGRAFAEPAGLNTLKYRAAHRLHLRNILFNNPHLAEIRQTFPNDTNRWDEWLKRMKSGHRHRARPVRLSAASLSFVR